MEWNEGLGDTSIDDIFNFTEHVPGAKKKKRSSILKQSKYDFCENEETITDNRRKSQRMKRVSFAETFQVKELNTGNIYDIPGWNESNSSKGNRSAEPEQDKAEGNFTSRSVIPDPASILEDTELNAFKETNSVNRGALYKSDEFEAEYPPFVSLEKSSTGIQFENETHSPYYANKTFRELLADDMMEMTMIQSTDNWSIASEAYGKKALEAKNYTVERVVSQSVRTWKADKGAPDKVSSFNDFFGDSPLKKKYADNKENVCLLPSAEANKSSSSIHYEVETTEKSIKQTQEKMDPSSKENVFQVSPKFQNLKFIDSPPPWKFGSENILKSQNGMDLKSSKSSNHPKQVNTLKKDMEEVLVQNHRKGLRPQAAEDRVWDAAVQDCLPQTVNSQTWKSVAFGEKDSAVNKTLHNVVSMDLTLLPNGLSEDSDTSCIQGQDGYVDFDLCQNEAGHKSNRHPDNSNKVSEKTFNKTRRSLCDMEMTCLNPLDTSSLCASPSKENFLEKTTVENSSACKQDIDINFKWPTSESAFSNNDIKAAGDFREKSNNKTRFSTCDMDITCMVSGPTDGDSFSICPQKSEMSDNFSSSSKELSFLAISDKENLIQSRDCVSEAKAYVTQLPLKGVALNPPFDISFSSDEDLSPVFKPSSVVGNNQVHTNINKENKIHNRVNISETTSFVTDLPLERNESSMKPTFNLNFSDDDEELPSVPYPVVLPGGNVGEKQVDTNISFFEEKGDSSRMEITLSNKNDQYFSKIDKNFDVIEYHNLKQDKQNIDICDAAVRASGRKYLKVSSVPESVDRIQTSLPDKETISDSFLVNNKENFHSNRKRNMFSNFKSAELPLGEKKDAEEGVLKTSVSGKALSSIDSHPMLGIVSLGDNALENKAIPQLVDPCLPEITNNMSFLLQSKAMNLSCHNACSDSNVNVSSPIAKEVHILTKTNISKDNVVISSSKYERYSTSNYMDLSCIPESENSPSVLDTLHETDAHDSETEPASKASYPDNSSAFKHVASLDHSHPGNYSQMSIYDNKTAFQDGKCTQHFTSQAMDLTCMKSNLQDISLCVTQEDYGGEHPAPPYFRLQEVPLVMSPNQERFRNNPMSGGMGGKMFKLCTDNFSFSSALSKTPGTRKRALSFDSSKIDLPTALQETCFKDKSDHTVLDSDSNLNVGTANMPASVAIVKHSVKLQNDNSEALVKKQLLPSTPGVIYSMKKKKKQSLKENVIFFPELSHCMKNQKFNFKHPYSDMRISNPVCKPGKLSRSFDGCSRETSFTCQPRESSVCPPIEPLPSVSQDLAQIKSSIPSIALRESLSRPKVDTIPNILPIETLPSVSPTKLDLSHKKFHLNPSAALHGSMSMSKVDMISNGEEFSNMEDSMQLLPSSVLESSFLDGDSKHFATFVDSESKKITSIEDYNTEKAVHLTVPYSQSLEQKNPKRTSSFADRILENDLSFPVASLGGGCLEGTPSSSQRVNTPSKIPRPESQKMEFVKTHISQGNKSPANTPSKIPRLGSQKMASINVPLSQESRSPAKADGIHPLSSKIVTSSEVINGTTLPQELTIVPSEVPIVEKEMYNPNIPDDTLNEMQEREVMISSNGTPKKLEGGNPSEVPIVEKEMYNPNIPDDTLNEMQEREVMISSNGTPKKLEGGNLHDSMQHIVEAQNEEILKNQVKKSENCETHNDGNSSAHGESILSLSMDSNFWKEKFEKASSGEGMKWRMKSLQEDDAVFEIFWKVHVFRCVVQADVKRISASQCSISFLPIGEKFGKKSQDSVVGDIEERTYNYFQYLATDTVLPFTIYSEDMIEKLAKYSKIAKNVETLMLDLLKLAVIGLGDDVSHELDPLKVCFRVVNENYECVFDVTFRVDLKKYPRERIVPQLKHVHCKDITKEVEIAVSHVEPGKDYLFRMIDVARSLKP